MGDLFQNSTAFLNLIANVERNCWCNLPKAGGAATGGNRSDYWNCVRAGTELTAVKSVNRILDRELLCQLFPRHPVAASLNVAWCGAAISRSYSFSCFFFFSPPTLLKIHKIDSRTCAVQCITTCKNSTGKASQASGINYGYVLVFKPPKSIISIIKRHRSFQ